MSLLTILLTNLLLCERSGEMPLMGKWRKVEWENTTVDQSAYC